MHLPDDFSLETPRCRLRQPNAADIPQVFSATRVQGFNDGMLWDPPATVEELQAPLMRSLQCWRNGEAFTFSIDRKQDAVFVGRISIRPTAWSLDSRSFASRVSNGGDPSRNGIYLSHLAGRGQSSIWDVQVTGAHDDVPIAFSPSGGQLLFVRTEGPGDNSGPLYLLGLSTGNVRQVSLEGVRVYTDGYFGGGASWSPDGSRIAWAGTDENGDANRMSVRVSAPDGTGVVTKSPTGAFITSAHWSPDGEWIAYDAPAPNGVHDLFVVDPDSETTRPLTEDFVPGVCCARWSPDSRALLVAGTEGDNDHSVLLAVPVDGSGIRQITSTPAFYTDFSWGLATR